MCLCLHIGCVLCCVCVCKPVGQGGVSSSGQMMGSSVGHHGCVWLHVHPREGRSKNRSQRTRKFTLTHLVHHLGEIEKKERNKEK